jgi:hypothetical protein
MIAIATWLTTLAVALGVVLVLWHLRGTEAKDRPPSWLGLLHGVLGFLSLILLAVALRGPARGVAAGAGNFGVIAAWLFAAALASGLYVWTRRRKGPAISMAVHAGLAVIGWTLLIAWNALG